VNKISPSTNISRNTVTFYPSKGTEEKNHSISTVVLSPTIEDVCYFAFFNLLKRGFGKHHLLLIIYILGV
jgi:hypothetical protein